MDGNLFSPTAEAIFVWSRNEHLIIEPHKAGLNVKTIVYSVVMLSREKITIVQNGKAVQHQVHHSLLNLKTHLSNQNI